MFESLKNFADFNVNPKVTKRIKIDGTKIEIFGQSSDGEVKMENDEISASPLTN